MRLFIITKWGKLLIIAYNSIGLQYKFHVKLSESFYLIAISNFQRDFNQWQIKVPACSVLNALESQCNKVNYLRLGVNMSYVRFIIWSWLIYHCGMYVKMIQFSIIPPYKYRESISYLNNIDISEQWNCQVQNI